MSNIHVGPILRVNPWVPRVGVKGNPAGVKGLTSKLSPQGVILRVFIGAIRGFVRHPW